MNESNRIYRVPKTEVVMRLLSPICRGFQPRRRKQANCISVPPEIVKKPDPAIYSQSLELSRGNPPTWNSPDVVTHQFPDFTPLEEFEITIRNLSPEVSAFNTQVDTAWSTFGIGLPRAAIGAVALNLQRAGLHGDVQTVRVATPPALRAAGRFSLFLKVRHPYDTDLSNNEGEQAFDSQRTRDVGRAMTFRFPVRNSFNIATDVTLLVNPVRWGVDISPAMLELNPGQEAEVQVSFLVPENVDAGTRHTFSVYGLTALGLLGGVGLVVHVD
jgi:hypothetical protein